MAIQVQKAYLADSKFAGATLNVNLDNEITTITLPGVLRDRVPFRVSTRYWVVIYLVNGKRGEDVMVRGYFVSPEGNADASFSSNQKWKSKGRHIMIIRLASENLYFSGDGDYELRFTLNGVELCTIPFTVVWSDAISGSKEPDN